MPQFVSRRDIVGRILPSALVGAPLATVLAAAETGAAAPGLFPPLAAGFKDGAYVLPPLPYAYDALEPHIDAETMKLHHDKHHKGYVDGLNKTLKSLADLRSAAGEMNISALSGLEEDLSFNGSGHLLHCLFWSVMGPKAGGEPKDAIAGAIGKSFGSTDAFRSQFSKVAGAIKGSGWAVLAYEPIGDHLIVLQVKQHDLQFIAGIVPLLQLDVWEHAYYLKYRNLRADYVKAWWNTVNWAAVNEAYELARKASGRA